MYIQKNTYSLEFKKKKLNVRVWKEIFTTFKVHHVLLNHHQSPLPHHQSVLR